MSSNRTKPTGKEKNTRGQAQEKKAPLARRSRYEQRLSRSQRRRVILLLLALIGGAIIVLGVIFFRSTGTGTSTSNSLAGQYAFQVGNPGPGAQAPEIALPATDGSTFDLAAHHGKTVLLYFQEGLTCQPCWDQLKDIQTHLDQFHALGITSVVSITTDPLAQLKQKVTDEGLSVPVLSDPSGRSRWAHHLARGLRRRTELYHGCTDSQSPCGYSNGNPEKVVREDAYSVADSGSVRIVRASQRDPRTFAGGVWIFPRPARSAHA